VPSEVSFIAVIRTIQVINRPARKAVAGRIITALLSAEALWAHIDGSQRVTEFSCYLSLAEDQGPQGALMPHLIQGSYPPPRYASKLFYQERVPRLKISSLLLQASGIKGEGTISQSLSRLIFEVQEQRHHIFFLILSLYEDPQAALIQVDIEASEADGGLSIAGRHIGIRGAVPTLLSIGIRGSCVQGLLSIGIRGSCVQGLLSIGVRGSSIQGLLSIGIRGNNVQGHLSIGIRRSGVQGGLQISRDLGVSGQGALIF